MINLNPDPNQGAHIYRPALGCIEICDLDGTSLRCKNKLSKPPWSKGKLYAEGEDEHVIYPNDRDYYYDCRNGYYDYIGDCAVYMNYVSEETHPGLLLGEEEYETN